MDWYKHKTSSHDDPDISDAMDCLGDFGYSGFFILLELYGQEFSHINSDGYLKLSKAFLQRKLRKRWDRVELLLNFFSKEISEPRFLWTNEGQYITLQVPKFIELASNWTGRKNRKDLQRDNIEPTAIEVEVDKKKKRKKASKIIEYTPLFEEFWEVYPRKKSKQEAFASWCEAGKYQRELKITMPQIIEAVKKQVGLGMFNLTENMEHCPYPSTWLNKHRWEDEIPKESRDDPPIERRGAIDIKPGDKPDWEKLLK